MALSDLAQALYICDEEGVSEKIIRRIAEFMEPFRPLGIEISLLDDEFISEAPFGRYKILDVRARTYPSLVMRYRLDMNDLRSMYQPLDLVDSVGAEMQKQFRKWQDGELTPNLGLGEN